MSIRFRIPLWAEIAAAILVALAVSNLATIVFFQIEGERRWQRFGDEILADRIGDTANAILAAPEAKRAELLKAFSKAHEHFSIDTMPLVDDKGPRDPAAERRIASHITGVANGNIRVRSMPPGRMFFVNGINGGTFGFARGDGRPPDGNVGFIREGGMPAPEGGSVAFGTGGAPPPEAHLTFNTDGPPPQPNGPSSGAVHFNGRMTRPPERMVVSIPAGVGRWLNARVGMPEPPALPWLTMFSAGIAATTLLVAAIWTARRVAVPLQRLSEAARAMRRGEPTPPVPETGPAAVRDATRSFNAMSQRLMATLESQRAMMVAIAHDLRTPIASLRLRAEFVTDEETKGRLLETLSEMQSMTEAALDVARTGHTGEEARAVDLSALAESLAADMAELGSDVTFSGSASARCICRTGEVKRALRNLIENAVRYGKRARISVRVVGEFAEIVVDDDGPGIPIGDFERVFEPFARLEASRSRETGGYGLGLSIARLVVRGHGGDVKLENREDGTGLRAILSLPLAG